MARQPTGRPPGRPLTYVDEAQRPVSIALRIPRDLATQMQRYAYEHRQTVTALLLDGLRWRLAHPGTSRDIISSHGHTVSQRMDAGAHATPPRAQHEGRCGCGEAATRDAMPLDPTPVTPASGLDFDPLKYELGPPCSKRQHASHGERGNLRDIVWRKCVACGAEKKTAMVKRQTLETQET